MRFTQFFLFGLFLAHLAGCASGPPIAPGKGNIHGLLTAASHKDFLAKNTQFMEGSYTSTEIGPSYDGNMVNYPALDELYAVLIAPAPRAETRHSLQTGKDTLTPRSLAVAFGDTVAIQNNSGQTQNFYLTDGKQGFQALAPALSGQTVAATIQMEGILELRSEDNENLVATLLSRRGLQAKKLKSGDSYSFEGLDPGKYEVLFWYWRLGFIQHNVEVPADKNVRLDEQLSPDRVVAKRLRKK